MAKSLVLTYIFWLIGGIFGLHHFYLRRDRHAFIWWISVGGYFGLGWIRDLWRIPEYVKDANEDLDYIEKLAEKMKKQSSPKSSSARLFGQVMIADGLGYLVQGALPTEYLTTWQITLISAALVPLAAAIGVHLVGNVGRHQGSFLVAIVGAYLTTPLFFLMQSSVMWASLASAALFNNFSKKWRRAPRPRRSFLRRVVILSLCGLLYISLWSSWFYFNCSMTDRNQEEVKCREATKHFFTSPIWMEFKSVMRDLYIYARYHGWRDLWQQLLQAFDPRGETNALKVLGLESNASQGEITSRYRQLSRQWHPDRFSDPQAKSEAQETFISIQQAYETLSHIKSQRLTRNKKHRDNP